MFICEFLIAEIALRRGECFPPEAFPLSFPLPLFSEETNLGAVFIPPVAVCWIDGDLFATVCTLKSETLYYVSCVCMIFFAIGVSAFLRAENVMRGFLHKFIPTVFAVGDAYKVIHCTPPLPCAVLVFWRYLSSCTLCTTHTSNH